MARIGVLAIAVLAAWPAAALAQLELTRVSAAPEWGGRSALVGYFTAAHDGSREVFSSVLPDGAPGYYERVGDATRRLASVPADRQMGGAAASDDASTLLLDGHARLTPGDTDDAPDLYLLRGSEPILLTPGTDAQQRRDHAGGLNSDSTSIGGLSADGARALFTSPLQLASADADDVSDVYAWEAGVTTLLSTGVEGVPAHLMRHSADGRTVVYSTPARVTADDTDDVADLYLVSNGLTRKVTPGNGPHFTELSDLSDDGGAVLFATAERLAGDDTDDEFDLYRAGPDGVQRVTTGPRGDTDPPSPHRKWNGFFMDGAGRRVAFRSNEPLTHDDQDTITDVFVWDAGTVTRVSQGPSGGNAERLTLPGGEWKWAQASLQLYVSDGAGVYFQTAEALTADDTDGVAPDLYEHRDGETRLVSTGPGGDPDAPCRALGSLDDCTGHAAFVSADGGRVVFATRSRLVGADTDDVFDVYQRAGGVTTLLSPARPDVPLHRDVWFADATLDGSTVYLRSEESLTVDDLERQGNDVFRVRPPAPGTASGGLSGPDPGAPATPPPATTEPGLTARELLRLLNRPRRLRLLPGRTRVTRRGAGLRLRSPRRMGVTLDLLRRGRRVARLRLTVPTGRSTVRLGRRLPRGRRLRAGRHVIRIVAVGSTPIDVPLRLLAPRR